MSHFTHLGGVLQDDRGPLFESLAPVRAGWRHVRGRTDGICGVVIPAAEVELGSPDESGNVDEQPRYQVQMNSFIMDAEPVSGLGFRCLSTINELPNSGASST